MIPNLDDVIAAALNNAGGVFHPQFNGVANPPPMLPLPPQPAFNATQTPAHQIRPR